MMSEIKPPASTTCPPPPPSRPDDHRSRKPYSQDAYDQIIFRSLLTKGNPPAAPLPPSPPPTARFPSDHSPSHILTPPASARGDITPNTAASASRPSSPRLTTPTEVATEQHQPFTAPPPPTMGAPEHEPQSRVVDEVVQAFQNLTTDNNYKIVTNVFTEVLYLKERNRSLTLTNRELLEDYRSYRNELEDDLKAKMEEKDREISDITNAKNELADQKADLESQVEDRDRQLDHLKQVRADLESQKADLESTVEAKNKELDDLNAVKARLESEKSDLETTLAEKVKELANLNEAKTTLEGEKAALESKVEAKEEEIAELTDSKSKLEKELADLNKVCSQLEADLAETNTKFEEHRKQAEAAAAAAAEEIASLKKMIKERDEELKDVKDNLSDVTSKFEAAQSRIATLEGELKDMTDLANEKKARVQELEGELETTKARVATLEEELKAMTERADSETSRADGLQVDLDNVTAKAESLTARVATLESELSDMTAKADEANANVNRLEGDLHEVETELHDKTERLNELESYRVTLRNEPEDTYVEVLDKIWTSIAALVESQFRQDLDASVLADASCWAHLRNSEYLKQARQAQIPLPQSNSAAAKQMRVAAVLAVLSRSLHRHVFRPVYLVDDDSTGGASSSTSNSHGNGSSNGPSPDRDILARLLRAMEAETPSREAHFRATLLAALPERQRASAARRARTVAREVSWLVQHLLSALQFEDFCARLEAACTLACMEWMHIQRANIRIEAHFGPPYEDLDWQVLPLPQFDNFEGTERRREVVVGHDGDEQDEGALIDDHEDTTVEVGHPIGDDGRSDAADTTRVHEELEVEPEEIMLVVWPSMCAVEHGHLESITQGLVISKDQVRTALEEVRGRGRNKPSTRRARTLSLPGRGSSSSMRQSFLPGADGGDSNDG